MLKGSPQALFKVELRPRTVAEGHTVCTALWSPLSWSHRLNSFPLQVLFHLVYLDLGDLGYVRVGRGSKSQVVVLNSRQE